MCCYGYITDCYALEGFCAELLTVVGMPFRVVITKQMTLFKFCTPIVNDSAEGQLAHEQHMVQQSCDIIEQDTRQNIQNSNSIDNEADFCANVSTNEGCLQYKSL